MYAKIFAACLPALLLGACHTLKQPQPVTAAVYAPAESSVSGNLIIFYDATVGTAPLMQAVQDYGASVLYQYKTLNGMAVRLPQGVSAEAAGAHFRQIKGVLSAEPDRVMQLH
ncbi:S8 family serine peptidase [Neisseria perflava]|uniref:S8 family serine peptidase n=1 Tax=Neisseria perflava TaxID=33053 RepID=UPI0020A0343E|nr:hypothetical protein [Neisseria perflava]MCP1660915.1 hypothetical protein [Neisseria perflava]MCP1771245.1 hypothetical protein [Neisseria perflava]